MAEIIFNLTINEHLDVVYELYHEIQGPIYNYT